MANAGLSDGMWPTNDEKSTPVAKVVDLPWPTDWP